MGEHPHVRGQSHLSPSLAGQWEPGRPRGHVPPPSALRPGTQGTELPSRLQIKCLHGEEALSGTSSRQKSKVTAPNQRRGGAGAGPGHVYAGKTPKTAEAPSACQPWAGSPGLVKERGRRVGESRGDLLDNAGPQTHHLPNRECLEGWGWPESARTA